MRYTHGCSNCKFALLAACLIATVALLLFATKDEYRKALGSVRQCLSFLLVTPLLWAALVGLMAQWLACMFIDSVASLGDWRAILEVLAFPLAFLLTMMAFYLLISRFAEEKVAHTSFFVIAMLMTGLSAGITALLQFIPLSVLIEGASHCGFHEALWSEYDPRGLLSALAWVMTAPYWVCASVAVTTMEYRN